MWYRGYSVDNTPKPSTIEEDSSKVVVFVRKDFVEAPSYNEDGKESGTHWEWMETKIKKEDWEVYKLALQNQADISDLTDAVIELAGILGGE